MATRQTLHEQLLAELLAEIISGEHPVGETLPKEVALAESFDVSRYVARQGIQALRDRGIVRVKHGVGAFVAPRDEWNLFDPVLIDAMVTGPEASHALAEAADLLLLAWPPVAAFAAQRRTASDLERVDGAADGAELLSALADAAGNRFLRQVVASLDRAARRAGAGPPPQLKTYRALVAAVREQDAEGSREAMAALAEKWARSLRRQSRS